MRRRRFMLAASALAAPFAGLPGCGGGDSGNGPPAPVPPSDVVLTLPKDMYLHTGAPTEWWWHIGTLRAGTRVFGFEINAASFAKDNLGFSQVMLSDVANQMHYQRTAPFFPPFLYDPNTWAESSPAKPWYARLGDPDNVLSGIEVTEGGSGYASPPLVLVTGGGGIGALAAAALDNGRVSAIALISPGIGYTSTPTITLIGGGGTGASAKAYHSYVGMTAPASDPTKNMQVKALLVDQATGKPIKFDLTFSQQGRPFFVWGTGVNPDGQGSTVQTRNYYFSLTRLAASGTIDIAGEKHAVSGTTWMDHEYGAFGTDANPVKWFLQDMQLDNGVCISNYATLGAGQAPKLNVRTASHCTVQGAEGDIWFVDSFVTPIGDTWTSPSGVTYFLQFHVEIPSFNASLLVTSLVPDQTFSGVYEGVAQARGSFQYRDVTGTAWNEQAL
jgi:predicted secreted hydrolase